MWILLKQGSGWQWRQLGHMQVCTLPWTDTRASTPPPNFFTGQMPFLPASQQYQSTSTMIHNSVDFLIIRAEHLWACLLQLMLATS